MTRPPDVVFVVWDTVRAADVSLYGAPATTTPFLERLAERSTVYTRCGSVSPWTLPSHASLFTGLLPTAHGANETNYRLEDGPATLAELFGKAGYETIAVVANDMVSRPAGLVRGFNRFLPLRDLLPAVEEHPRTSPRLRTLLERADHEYGRLVRFRYDHGGARTNRFVDRALSRLPDDRPVFLFVNFIDAHLPYGPPEPFRSRFLPAGMTARETRAINQSATAFFGGQASMSDRDFEGLLGLYRGEIAYLDARLAELVKILDRHRRWDGSLFAVTSDHGENIGDHGLMDHQACVYETLLSVPLVVRWPGQRDGARVDGVVQAHDLGATALQAAGLAFPGEVHAKPLPMDGAPSREAVVSEYVTLFPSIDLVRRELPHIDVSRLDRGYRSARDAADLKLIVATDGEEELFDLAADPGETANLAAARPDDVARLKTHLPDWSGVVSEGPDMLEAEIEERLRALGYVE